ncbi:MAG: hypothetical protein R3A52_15145 [Polyangiales bacterium]
MTEDPLPLTAPTDFDRVTRRLADPSVARVDLSRAHGGSLGLRPRRARAATNAPPVLVISPDRRRGPQARL